MITVIVFYYVGRYFHLRNKSRERLVWWSPEKIFIPQSTIEIQDVCWWNWNISEFDDVLAHYLGYGLNTKDMNKELLYVLVSGGEAKIHCIYFIVLNWKTTIVDSRKALYLSYFQNWFSTSMCQQSIMVFINLFSSNLLYRCVVPCLNRLTLVGGLNFQNNLASLNIQGALPLSIFVSIFIFFKNALVAIELLLI